jgi:threonine/homoserine/homoserine lactone efflux protein
MASVFFLKGLVIGFAMAVPIGPAGILCIRKTLAEGRSYGLMIGLGAATADMLCGSIAAFGLTFVADAIAGQQFALRSVGGVLMLFLGVKTLRTARNVHNPLSDGKGHLGSYLSALVFGLTNPVTVFAFLAVFAVFGLGQKVAGLSSFLPVLGVFAGSSLWFVVLGFVATILGKQLDAGGLRWVNIAAGILLLLSSVLAFGSLIWPFGPTAPQL